MVQKVLKFIRQHRLIIAITLIGAFLRLYRIEASLQFLGDQGRDALVLRNIFIKKDLPFIGPITSVGGFFLGPFYYYLMAPFLLLFNFNPVGPAYAQSFIGILTIPALYYVTYKMLSKKAALITSLLYALAALPVIQTRGAWNPNPMPLAVLGIVYGFYESIKTNQKKWLYLSSICLGIALQLHYMTVFLGPFILFKFLKVFKQKKLRPHLFIYLLIVIMTMIPLILFEIKNNYINIQGLIKYLNQYPSQELSLLTQFRNLKGRSEQAIGMLLGFGQSYSSLREWLTRLIWIPAVFLLFKKPTLGYQTITAWLFLSIAALTFFPERIPAYYLGFIFPAVFMLTGYLLSLLKNKLKIIIFIFFILFIYSNTKILYPALTENGNLKSVQKTARFILKDIQQNNYQNYNLTLLDDTKDYKAYAFRYYLEVFGGRPLAEDQYPKTNVLYVISPYQQKDILSIETWEIKSIKPAELIEAWEFKTSENIYKIKRL